LYIFKKSGLGLAFLDDPQSLGKKVPFILPSKLLAGDGKRGTWHPAGDKIHLSVSIPAYFPHIGLNDVPIGTIHAEGRAAVGIDLHNPDRLETCFL
jgi:hypothetical protein